MLNFRRERRERAWERGYNYDYSLLLLVPCAGRREIEKAWERGYHVLYSLAGALTTTSCTSSARAQGLPSPACARTNLNRRESGEGLGAIDVGGLYRRLEVNGR